MYFVLKAIFGIIMHDIEPYYNWRNYYVVEEDVRSPFYAKTYSEFEFTDKIYNFYIHPQWDNIGSPTLFLKVIYADYKDGVVIMELLGEWNDTLYNDIMTLKRDIADHFINEGVSRFILIAENVLNFHNSDDCYYEEWFEDVEDGWVALLNVRNHMLSEFYQANIDNYLFMGGELNEIPWRTYTPVQLVNRVQELIKRRLD
ncbi:MAG: hypothetical protein ACK4K0_09260 [Flavobacteriales bacterium]